jgi:hypothetical protein
VKWHTSYAGNISRPYLKDTYSKRAGGVALVVECLPGKHKALSLNHSTACPPEKKEKEIIKLRVEFSNRKQKR